MKIRITRVVGDKEGSTATVCGALAVATLCILSAGCSPSPDAQGGGSQAGGTKAGTVVAPMAKPGAKIGENNPPPGQPNHMSPEMEAQMKSYQEKAGKK